MTIETAYFVMKIAGALIMILLAVSGFFLKNVISTVSELKSIVLKLEALEGVRGSQCSLFHSIIDKRLENFTKEIQNLDHRLTILESKSS